MGRAPGSRLSDHPGMALLRCWLLCCWLLLMAWAGVAGAAPGTGGDAGVVAGPPDDADYAGRLAGEADSDVDTPGSAAELQAHVDGLVAALRREHQLGAVTLAVVRDDALLFARGYGLADLDSERQVAPEQTLFRIGSVAKTFTWTAVMMLAERGAVDLDADVNDYLQGVQVAAAFDAPVTLRDLMHHRAGFEDSMRLFAVADDDPRSLAEVLAAHQPARVFPPGARTAYSNWGSALAALVVEQVAGVDYATFLHEEILTPLRMHATIELPPAQMSTAQRGQLATGYRRRQGGLALQGFLQIGAYWPAGGMASTATDMARWMRFHLNGGELDGVRLLAPETHAAMWTRGFDDRPHASDLAHGFQDRPYRGLRTLGHAGGTAAFLTNMILVPELGMGLFVSQNTAFSEALADHLPDLVIDHLVGHVHLPFKAPEEGAGADALADIAGSYLSNRRPFTSQAALFGLTSPTRIQALSATDLLVAAMGRETLYRKVSGQDDLFESASGRRMQVLRDDRGRVAAIADSSGVLTAERVGLLQAPAMLYVSIVLAVLLAITTTLGAVWRQGHRPDPGRAARLAAVAATLGVLAVAVFVAALITLAASFADFDLAEMPGNYANAGMYFLHWAGWAIAVAAVCMLLAQWPAWRGAGWGLWRRLHFALFTLAVLGLTLQLWHWRVIAAPVY